MPVRRLAVYQADLDVDDSQVEDLRPGFGLPVDWERHVVRHLDQYATRFAWLIFRAWFFEGYRTADQAVRLDDAPLDVVLVSVIE